MASSGSDENELASAIQKHGFDQLQLAGVDGGSPDLKQLAHTGPNTTDAPWQRSNSAT
jgi:hypothetical protein